MKENKNIKANIKATNKILLKNKKGKNWSKYNLLYIILITTFLILSIQFIFKKSTKHKEIKNQIFLRNTESKDYSVDKSLSYDENAKKIYSQNNSINFNQLDISYNGVKAQDISEFNNIHIALCINEDYHLLASVTIASILKNADPKSFIHLHIIALNNLKLGIMKKIYSLKAKINNNSEFIFYNGSKVEQDFELGIKTSERGAIDYGRLLITEVLNESIEKVISLDIGDIFVEKDLFGLYSKNIGYKGYLGVPDAYPRCFLESIFNHKEKYVNGGVLLINVKKWKEIDLYKYIVKMFKYVLTKTKFYNPYTDIMNDFLPWGSTGYLSLKYNFPDYIIINENDQKKYEIWTKKCSYYHDKEEKVIEGEKDVIIRNLFNYKVYQGKGTNEMKILWNNYAKLTGFYDEICKKYVC